MKNVLLGIGNDQGMDDGIGVYIAEKFRHPEWQVYNCGTVPENFTSVIRRAEPDNLIMVDAACMQLEPGTIRRISVEKIDSVGGGTHAMPLSLIMNIMQRSVKNPIIFIGIEPEIMGEGNMLSQSVFNAAQTVIGCLENDGISELDFI